MLKKLPRPVCAEFTIFIVHNVENLVFKRFIYAEEINHWEELQNLKQGESIYIRDEILNLTRYITRIL